MGIFSQVMFLFGMTFLISMFVALIIKGFAKAIEILNDETSFIHRKKIQKQ